ncbi:hypothetical protein BASA50_002322 [Batrachochytrium salamandrivorans]|uniref:F-box domain-containing protein n=1 Tax=Batrachochytrium salamandrivorans TaxID=1357716 RepID=A0ABQ8FLP1_9FUNG|nr:hypothetical protein BASA50_002322 [Batrachochytrium salamandrivorans]
MLADCPVEVWATIFSFLHPDSSLRIFPQICKQALRVSASPSVKALFFLTRYGRHLAFYYAYQTHRKALDIHVAGAMLQNGALLPRFVAQKVTSDFHTQANGGVSTPLFMFFVNHAYELYDDLVMFKENDHSSFERLVRAPISETNLSREKIRTLIHQFRFTPVAELCSKPIADSIYYLSRLDLTLVANLASNGFDLLSVSDSVMEKIMVHPYLNTRYLKRYLDSGFVISDLCIKRALAGGRAQTVAVLNTLVDEQKLQRLAWETVKDLFGPYLDRSTSLNIPWSSSTVHRLIHTFNVPDTIIAKALLSNPNSVCTLDTVHPEFPVTRCYLKARPYPVWEWVLSTYGPHHLFSVAAMDDALSRAVADQELHDLHQLFLDAGFVFRPRHIKILACRLLHRNMTGNSLKLLLYLQEQVLGRQQKSLFEDSKSDKNSIDGGKSNDSGSHHSHSDDVNCISNTEIVAFRKAISDEIVNNEEWGNRMRTLQLEGGPRGGAVRINHPPEDGLRFLEEARKILRELHALPVPVVAHPRREAPREKAYLSEIEPFIATGSDSQKPQESWINRMQDWWRSRTTNTTGGTKKALISPIQSQRSSI